MSLADELLADLEEVGDEVDDEEQNQVWFTHVASTLERWVGSLHV